MFSAINQVVSSCFGQALNKHFEYDIEQFRLEILNLGIKITPKIHAILHHVPEFIKANHRALGFYSELASASNSFFL